MIERVYLQKQLGLLDTQRVDAADIFLANVLDHREEFESSLRRMFTTAVDFLYVGTVHRGLAGSTSDIDILVLLKDAKNQLPMPMIQHQNDSRVGIQTMDLSVLRSTIDELELWNAHAHIPEPREIGALKVSIRMLERAINGLNFEGIVPLKEHLFTLAETVARIEAGGLYSAAIWARIAHSARRDGAAEGYWLQAVMHARESVMAIGGDVQANRKWVGERWRHYLADSKPERISSLIELVEKMKRHSRSGDFTSAFTFVRKLLEALGTVIPHQLNPAIKQGVSRERLTEQATVLGKKGVAICVSTEELNALLDNQRGVSDEFGEAEAGLLLDLAQLDMLGIAPLSLQSAEREQT